MRTLKTKNRMLSLFQDDRIIAVIDTETTGINSNKDRIVQFSGKKYRIRDQKMEQIAEMDIYIKAPFPMPEAAMRVNGITDEFLADKPSEEDVVAEICAFMEGSILVGYNVDFDIRMISALCDRTHTPLQCSGKMDVLEVARDLVEKKEVQNHKLETISKYFGIDEGITFHSSIDDVEATARLLLLFYTMYCEQDMHGEGKTKLFIEYTYFWKGYRKEQAGVYVQTNLGKVYFSTYKKEWCSSQLDLTQIDLDALETDILVRLGITYDELSKMTEKKYHLLEKNAYRFCYVNDFPMYEYDRELKQYIFTHNPFSMPQGGLEALETKDPSEILAYQYDIVCNGIELSSGAVRNHDMKIMVKAFEIAGYTEEDLKEKFGALYNAFQFGAPPHAGMAPGVDRMIMLLRNEENIREIIPFPMNGNAQDLMCGAPGEVTEQQLREVHIKVRQ